jgi:hypothetical protein
MADIPDFSHKSSVRTMKPLQLSIRDRWPKVMLAMVVEIKGAHHPSLQTTAINGPDDPVACWTTVLTK